MYNLFGAHGQIRTDFRWITKPGFTFKVSWALLSELIREGRKPVTHR